MRNWQLQAKGGVNRTGSRPTLISADTSGQTLTCSATGQGGSITRSVTILRDATPPSVRIAAPANGTRYTNGSAVSAGRRRFTGDRLVGHSDLRLAQTLVRQLAGETTQLHCIIQKGISNKPSTLDR